MFGLQPLHWLVIILIAVLLFVPSRIPELVRAFRQTVKEFRATAKEDKRGTAADSNSGKESPH